MKECGTEKKNCGHKCLRKHKPHELSSISEFVQVFSYFIKSHNIFSSISLGFFHGLHYNHKIHSEKAFGIVDEEEEEKFKAVNKFSLFPLSCSYCVFHSHSAVNCDRPFDSPPDDELIFYDSYTKIT